LVDQTKNTIRNTRQDWKEIRDNKKKRIREQKTMKMIKKEKEETEQENLELRE